MTLEDAKAFAVFRGVTLCGERWVEGPVVVKYDKAYIITKSDVYWRINPSTLRASSGFVRFDGTMVFEGDIFTFGENTGTVVVCRNKDHFPTYGFAFRIEWEGPDAWKLNDMITHWLADRPDVHHIPESEK